MRLALGFLLAMLAQPLSAQAVEKLGWMAGDWVEAKGGQLTEESWMAPRGGVMLGMNRSGKAGAAGPFEFVRIGPRPDGQPSFNAQPNGAPPSAFPMVEQTAQSVTFANPAHDYPQRIRYWREGEHLMAEISLMDGSRAVRWRFGRRP